MVTRISKISVTFPKDVIFRIGVLVPCPKKESGGRYQGNGIVISELGTLHCS